MALSFFNDFLQRVGKNFLWLSLSHLCGVILAFGGTIYLARVLEPEGFGKISFALAIVGFFMQIANMGVSVLGTRDLAQNMDKYENDVQDILSFRIIQSFLSFSLLVFIVAIFPASTKEIKLLILIFGISLLISPFDLKWFFQGIEKMQYITLINVAGQLSYVTLLFFFVTSKANLTSVPVIYVIAQFLIPTLLGINILFFKFCFPKLKLNMLRWKTLLVKTYPIGLSLIIGELFYISDVIILKFMRGVVEVGYYNSATKIVFMINAIAGIFASSVFPQLAASFKNSLESFRSNLAHTMKIVISVVLPIAIIGTLTANHIIRLLYGESYEKAVIALQILVWMSFVYWHSIILLNGLIIMNLQKKQLVIMEIGISSNIILNLILVPFLGLIGASIASVSAFVIIFALSYFEIKKSKYLEFNFRISRGQ